MWFQLRQVDFYELIILCSLVCAKFVCISASKVTNGLTLGCFEVVVHGIVEWK